MPAAQADISFFDDANLLGDLLTKAFSFLREKPTIYLIAGPDLSLYTEPTMSFVRRLPCASLAVRSPVYVRPDIN